jgi:hypothetical protein
MQYFLKILVSLVVCAKGAVSSERGPQGEKKLTVDTNSVSLRENATSGCYNVAAVAYEFL